MFSKHFFFSFKILPPPLYIITPTYKRPEQVAEITRLGHTLKHIPNIFWLVIEDATVPTSQLTRQLRRIGIPFEHYTGEQNTIYLFSYFTVTGIIIDGK